MNCQQLIHAGTFSTRDEPKGFIAGDFLVRSKPPAALARPGVETAEAIAPTSHGRR